MRHYQAVPLADHGFVPTGEWNPVRWYVEEEGRAWPLLGPYKDQDTAERAAAQLNEGGER